MDFERELRDSLRRVDPPPGFAQRVLARVDPGAHRQRPRARWPLAIGLAASLVVGVCTVRYREYRQGERAKEQLMQALEITADKFAIAESKIQEIGSRSRQ